jgi:glycosyltransferase involved in cell wall biosynthesis
MEHVAYEGIPVADSPLAERLWHLTRLNSFAKRRNYDAILFPAGMRLLPAFFDVPAGAVVQEILSAFEKSSDDGLVNGFNKMQLKRVRRIIAASRFIRDDLVNQKIPESRVTVIPNGIDTSLFFPRPLTSSEAVLIQPFSIRRPYVIYASRIAYPAKCHVELIRGFDLFKRKTGLPHRLVLAGSDSVNAEMVHREVLASSVSSDILLTGYFPHENLPELYSAADACVFPSSAEGVGLPVLEAMACGIPVACARAGALPEMAGDGALYFDQNSPEEIADALCRIVKEGTGANDSFRAALIDKGLERAGSFSWMTCAEGTLRVLEEAAAGNA